MRPEIVIAEKEFRDHITSKRFLVVLAVLLLLAAYAMATGMDQYNKSLDQYKNEKATGASRYQAAVQGQQQMLDKAIESGASAEQVEYMRQNLEELKENMDYYLNPNMPSLLQVFQAYTLLLGLIGMVLGIAMGFDQLTKEKESGSLKAVLSAPVYRDSLINGKTIGSMASLAVAMGVMFLVTIAVMLFYGVVPGLDDLLRICLFFLASVLYCTTFFAIAMLTSAISRSSAMAVILAIGIVFSILIVSIASAIISSVIADAIVGPPPEYEMPVSTVYPVYDGTSEAYYVTSEANSSVAAPVAAPVIYTSPTVDYYNKRSGLQSQISDVLNIVSPAYDFMGSGLGLVGGTMYPGVAQALLTREKPTNYYSYVSYRIYDPYSRPAQASILDSLSYAWVKALAMVVETILAFALSYVIFMRMDVR